MVIFFIVVANQAFQCFFPRYCDTFSPVVLTKFWEAGVVELMFESAGVVKVYRKVKDRLEGVRPDRADKNIKDE